MSSIDDAKLAFYRTELGVTGGDVATLENQWLALQTGATGSNADLWMLYLSEYSGAVSDRLYDFLGELGYTGALQDRLLAAYIAGDLGNTNAFILTIDTENTSAGSSASNQFALPFIASGSYNCLVDWGDGNSDTITVWNAAAATHTYATPGVYTVTITGTLTRWYFNNSGDRLKVLTVEQWGTDPDYDYYEAAWYGASNVDFVASDAPNTTGVTSFRNCFHTCSATTQLPLLDTSSGTDFTAFARNCSTIASFPAIDTSSGTAFAEMCRSCTNLVTMPALDFSGASSMSSVWLLCSSLVTLPPINCGVASSYNFMCQSCTSLVTVAGIVVGNTGASWSSTFNITGAIEDITITGAGIGTNISVASNNMDAAALDALYTSLATVVGQTITVTGNPGTGSDDPTIATAKGWTVVD